MLVKHRIRSISSFLGVGLCAAMLFGCTTTTLLEVRFDADTPGAPPSVTQALGTVVVELGAGSVVVVDTPASDVTPANKKWARISHPTRITPETSMIARMPGGPTGNGSFSVTTLLYVPTGEAVPTIQLETIELGSGPASFLHVDLLADGSLRINDAATSFGHYPHDQPFLLSIQLDVDDTGATARVAPVGAEASGSAEVPIPAPSLARLFGAVRIWMGFQFGGTFFADDVVVVEHER
jgi:hypothetical protein